MSLNLGERNRSSPHRSALCGSRCPLVLSTSIPQGMCLCFSKPLISLHKHRDAQLHSVLPQGTPWRVPLTVLVVIPLLASVSSLKGQAESYLPLFTQHQEQYPAHRGPKLCVCGGSEWMNYKGLRKSQIWTSRKKNDSLMPCINFLGLT